jgi:MFS family permease
VASLRQIYREFPSRFWIVVGVHFVDKIGATLVFPFFALYITGKFGVGMTEAGVLLGLLSLAGILGSVVGGALTDRLGRRKLILFGLMASALSALTLGSVSRFAWLFPAAALVGLFSEVGGPAHAAMIADILPKEQRQEGFGILRVVGNMAWLVGPTVGGSSSSTRPSAVWSPSFSICSWPRPGPSLTNTTSKRDSSRRSATIASSSQTGLSGPSSLQPC